MKVDLVCWFGELLVKLIKKELDVWWSLWWRNVKYNIDYDDYLDEEDEEEDDCELVAVITAAIAASEGTAADGLVVRSIRKVGRQNNWK